MASLQESVICSLNFGTGQCSASNTIFGTCAGNAYTSGTNNVAIGFYAGRATSGSRRVSVGYKAGFASTTGSDNFMFGSLVGVANYNGNTSILIGQNAGYFTSYNSVGIGAGSLRTGTNIGNTAIGLLTLCGSGNKQCRTAIGYRAGIVNGGDSTVLVGYAAGSNAGGNCSVAIGAYTGRFGTNTNTTQVGFYAYDGNYCSNRFVLGKYGCSSAFIYVAWSNVSDYRDKTNIETLPNNLGLNFIRKLRPVSFKFDYRREYMFKCGFEFGEKDGTLKKDELNYGFLAQEIEKAAKDLNVTFDGVSYDEYNDGYTLKTLELISPIVKSIQELNNELDLIEQQLV